MNHPLLARRRAFRHLASQSMIAISTAAFALTGHADSKSASFGVSATVLEACNISGTALGFGNYDPLSRASVDAASMLTATCSAGSGYTIGLNAGSGAGATNGSRKLTHATDATRTLSYIVSASAAGGANWGSVGETGTASGTGSGTAQAIPVYGRITAGQTSAAMGLYNDTLIATIDF